MQSEGLTSEYLSSRTAQVDTEEARLAQVAGHSYQLNRKSKGMIESYRKKQKYKGQLLTDNR